MEIKFQDYANLLNKYNPIVYVVNDECRGVKGIKLLEKNQEELDPKMLYVGRISHLNKQSHNNSVVNLICVADKYIPKKFVVNKNMNLIVIDKRFDISAIFNELQEVNSKQLPYLCSVISARLMSLLVEDSGLQEIADAVFELIGNPVVIINLSNSFVFCSSVRVGHLVWDELVSNKYISLDLAAKYKSSGIIEELNTEKKNHVPFIIKGSAERPNRIAVNVFVRQKLAAHIIIPDLIKKFREAELNTNLKIAELIAGAVAVEVQKNQHIQYNRGHVHEFLIKDLLDGALFEKQELAQRLHNAGLKFKNVNYLMVINIKNHGLLSGKMDMAIEQLNLLFQTSTYQVYQDAILMLTSRDVGNYLSQEDETRINVYLVKNIMTGGLSLRFSNIGDLKKYFEQARIAIELGRDKDDTTFGLFCYKDFIMEHIVRICAGKADLTSLCHPVVFVLQEQDGINNTNYLDTLFTYIKHNKCAVAAASDLHIHRNTLNYRINKIAKIINIDWSDGELLAHIYLSLKMLKAF